MHFNYIRLI
ncbi:hypothetical protein CAJAP_09775 [Camponotus japonicus]